MLPSIKILKKCKLNLIKLKFFFMLSISEVKCDVQNFVHSSIFFSLFQRKISCHSLILIFIFCILYRESFFFSIVWKFNEVTLICRKATVPVDELIISKSIFLVYSAVVAKILRNYPTAVTDLMSGEYCLKRVHLHKLGLLPVLIYDRSDFDLLIEH